MKLCRFLNERNDARVGIIAGDDDIALSAGPGGSTIISGTSGGVPFESLQVAPDVSNFVLDTTSNNAAGVWSDAGSIAADYMIGICPTPVGGAR